MDPYTGYEDYDPETGYPNMSVGINDTDDKTSVNTDSEEESQPIITANTLDPNRHFEVNLQGNGFSVSDDYSVLHTGYGKIPLTAVFSDYKRVSLHPLGIVTRPPGIAESEWEQMDMDMIFHPAYDATLVDKEELQYEELAETHKSPEMIASGGSGGGEKKPPEEEEEEHDPSEMPFLDHLEEFRWALLKSIFAIVVCMIASWFLTEVFYDTIVRLSKGAELPLVYTRVMEPIMIKLEMALVMGLVIALPFIFYSIWSFVAPGLYAKEKKWILPLVIGATICFFIGASIAYFVVIPVMLTFIKNFIHTEIKPMITIGNFIGILLKFTLLFGILFELPLVTYVLAKIGIIKHTLMSRYRNYAIVFIFIIGAILTPPDPLSQIMMALPLILLYEISIIVARIAGRKTIL